VKYYTETMTKIILNEESGELETQLFTRDIKQKNRGKQGWTKMYKNGYDMVMLNLNSKLEMKLFISIRDSFTRNRVEVNISQVKLVKEFNTTKATVSRFIKKLVEIGFLIKISRGIYRMNPFIYVPYQEDAFRLQEEWKGLSENIEVGDKSQLDR